MYSRTVQELSSKHYIQYYEEPPQSLIFVIHFAANTVSRALSV